MPCQRRGSMKSGLLAILVGTLLLIGGPWSEQSASGAGGGPGLARRPELQQSPPIQGRAVAPRPNHRTGHKRESRNRRTFPNEGIVGLPAEVDQEIPAAPPVIIQEVSPASVEQQAPPVIPQPSYYWYYCGQGGSSPSSREQGGQYCLGGIRPSVRGRPGPGKPFELFEAEDTKCRAQASAEAGTLPGVAVSEAGDGDLASATTVQGRYDFSYQRCMVVKGNQIAPAGAPPLPSSPLPYPPPPPPPQRPRASAPAY
jgi:hypothetical protein